MKTAPNGPFYLSPTPPKSDKRPRNAFGVLKSFGKAYAAYYAKQDRKAKVKKS